MSDTEVFPPVARSTLQRVIRSYVYKQYEDDDDLQGFVAAQNYLAQRWLDDFNNLNPAVWSALSGSLLDWIGAGVYGIRRPTLSYQKPAPSGAGAGPYATMPYNTLAYNGGRLHPANLNPISYIPVTDDVYKRILTWHLYKGDGFQFSTRWLKRRIHRFLRGENGYLTPEDETYDVSLTFSGTTITATVTSNEIGIILQYAMMDGVLAIPFQFSVTVSPSVISFPNEVDGAFRAIADIRATATLQASISIISAVTASFSGNITTVRGSSLLAGTMAAAAGFSGDIIIRRANGTTAWPMSGAFNGTAGITTGNVNTRQTMGGIFPGEAG
jgi:hypothetical protein